MECRTWAVGIVLVWSSGSSS